MRQIQFVHVFAIVSLLSPNLLFWKRNSSDEQREVLFNDLYDIVGNVYETAANLKSEWAQAWDARDQDRLPPRFASDIGLPPRTILAAREMRYARSLLQRHRWRSVRQPLFEEVDPIAWAAMQRRMQIVSTDLLAAEEVHYEYIRHDEIDWLKRAIEGFDNARSYLRTAEREEEPLERRVANATYLSIHLALQLSNRLIERQTFELARDE